MIGQTFTFIGNPKLVFRLVRRGSIGDIDCVRGVALNGQIPDHEARHRRFDRRDRLGRARRWEASLGQRLARGAASLVGRKKQILGC
jgi:hypothetical protein